MEILNKIVEFIASAEGMVATIAVVMEFIFRLFPSKKPIGILQFVAKILHVVADILSRIAKFLDKVLPQNVIEESKEEVK